MLWSINPDTPWTEGCKMYLQREVCLKKKRFLRVIAPLTGDAVAPCRGTDRQVLADVLMNWIGFGWMSRWLRVFIHMSLYPFCESKRFYWVMALSSFFSVCGSVCSPRSSSALKTTVSISFWISFTLLLRRYLSCTCSCRVVLTVTWLIKHTIAAGRHTG